VESRWAAGGRAAGWASRKCARDYHLSLCEACGSPALLAQIASFYDLTRRYRRASLDDIAMPGDALFREHEEILHWPRKGPHYRRDQKL
jgi:DNA-binding GntR family transcriptional regulator